MKQIRGKWKSIAPFASAIDGPAPTCHVSTVPTAIPYPHIVKPADDSARLENHPRTRVSMIVADYLYHGWSAEEIARQYPYLTLAEIHAALTYYFDHRDEIEAELLEEDRLYRESIDKQPPSPLWFRLKALRRAHEK